LRELVAVGMGVNSSTHKTATIKQWLEKHPRFKLHFTPTSASWLNTLEGWFAQLECSGLMKQDIHLGENARQIEVSDDQATPFLFC
jgi:transposase